MTNHWSVKTEGEKVYIAHDGVMQVMFMGVGDNADGLRTIAEEMVKKLNEARSEHAV